MFTSPKESEPVQSARAAGGGWGMGSQGLDRRGRALRLPLRLLLAAAALALELDRRERIVRRTVDHLAAGVEARPVAGTVPGLLGGIPDDDAAEVGAGRRHHVQDPVRVAVAGDLPEPAAQHAALPDGDGLRLADVAARQPLAVFDG